jgi:putative glutamine amidotransferase
MRPVLIGITVTRLFNRFGHAQLSLNEVYSSSLSNVGAVPILIPLGLPEGQLEAILDRIDGVLFSGGGDAHPSRYHSQMHPRVDDIDEDRDRVEIHIAEQVFERRMPFLAICRGLQIINIASGGTLFEDILDQRPGSQQHQTPIELPRDTIAHHVRIETGTILAEILGSEDLPVNSNHHQAVRVLGKGLLASAYAPDGIIEAFEKIDYPYGLSVQWHPEWLQNQARMRGLFESLRDATS